MQCMGMTLHGRLPQSDQSHYGFKVPTARQVGCEYFRYCRRTSALRSLQVYLDFQPNASLARFIAGDAGFLTFIQSGDRPDL